MSNSPTLTIATIVGDDAAQDWLLELSLRQSAIIADEVVVIDSSLGNEVCDVVEYLRDDQGLSPTVEFIHRRVPWQGDYALQRNIALGWCHSDWVLFVDSDELIEDAFLAAWPEMLEDGKSAYLMPCYNFVRKPGEGLRVAKNGPMLRYPDYHLRLFRNDRDVRYTGTMHEQPGREWLDVTNGNGDTSRRLWWPEDEIGVLPYHHLHFGWARDPSFLARKLEARAEMEQRAIASGASKCIAETIASLDDGPWADRQEFDGTMPAIWDDAAMDPRGVTA